MRSGLRSLRVVVIAVAVAAAVFVAAASAGPLPRDRPHTLVVGGSDGEAVLPPVQPWNGASRRLMLSADDSWATPFEKSGGTDSPSTDETYAWLDRLVDEAPELAMVLIGASDAGRDIRMVIASTDQPLSARAALASDKPVLLVQACIHAGETDGKDAGMMLLRDMTVRGTKRELLENVNVLFIPILNVDGHDRSSAYGRINQRGPATMGWRTNARNLNLNRDYGKLDTPEMRAVVEVIRAWEPDLYIDIHVTDGVDYQYDVTWGYLGPYAFSPNGSAWLDTYFTPAAEADLTAMGHVPGRMIFAVDDTDIRKGVVDWSAGAAYSNGYGDLRHLPTVLVENHSLKPYERRVLGTYVLLESALRTLGAHGRQLARASAEDSRLRREEIPLGWQADTARAPEVEFLGVESRIRPSTISGGVVVEWTGEPVTLTVPRIPYDRPSATVSRPEAYWIPSAWPEVADRLARHGVEMERIDEPVEMDVTMYRIADAALDPDPREGRAGAAGTPVPETRRERFPAGSWRVPTDQPLGDLAAVLLEPGSTSSFFRWGFFLEILDRTEYVEAYVMEPTAARMLAEDPELAEEFVEKLRNDPAFAADSQARLAWFYRRTPYFDDRWRLYPVAREE